jgi:DDE_Tnp_1-associated/Transposase DDE domain
MRHRAAVVLAFAVAAVMAGADSVTAVSEWASDVPPEVLAALGAWRDGRGRLVPPSRSTFRRVLRRLDGQALAAVSGAWLTGQVLAGLADAGPLVIALDGKTVRGAKAGNEKAPHLLAAMICGARAVLAQLDVDQKTNEITQVKPLLDDAGISGALVTADALHVQKETARYLVEDKHAGYLFTAVKDNPAWPVRRARRPGLGEHAGRAHDARPRARTGRDPHCPGAARPRWLVSLRCPGVLDRADCPRPARRAVPLGRRRAGDHQQDVQARRDAAGHRRRRARPLGHRGSAPSATSLCAKMPSGSAPGHHPWSWRLSVTP